MDLQIQKRIQKVVSKKVFVVSLVVFVLLMLALTAQITYTVLKYDKVYKGVYVNNLNVSNITLEELNSLLEKEYLEKVNASKIVLKSADTSQNINFADVGVVYDIQKAAKEAYDVGRKGSIFKKLKDIFYAGKNGVKIDVSVAYNQEKIKNQVDTLYQKTLVDVKQSDVIIEGDKVTLQTGHSGKGMDKEAALKNIEHSIKDGKTSPIEIPVVTVPANKIDVDELYKKITHEPKNASVKIENNKVVVIPHTVGREIDKESLVSIVKDIGNQENVKKTIPIQVTQPKITTDELNAKLFKDVLGSMSTHFSTQGTNNANRGVNIRLATAKINGKILGPGDTFSFNGVVGPRTAAGGYKTAHAYIGGKIVDDVGGGICQVSTTLYNAALFSEMGITERINHMFTVSYVPYGRDAAVSYNTADLKFKNTSNYPVKIEGWVTSDNQVKFRILGTNESPGKSVDFRSQTVQTLKFPTEYINDPTMPEGETKSVQGGMTGYVVNTYKIVKENGKVVSETKLHTSRYQPLKAIIKKGTKKVEPTSTATPKIQTATPTAKSPKTTPINTPGIDDISNPPAEN